jgi:hypothetical protein
MSFQAKLLMVFTIKLIHEIYGLGGIEPNDPTRAV